MLNLISLALANIGCHRQNNCPGKELMVQSKMTKIFLKNDGQRHEAKVFLDVQEVVAEKRGLDR